MIAKTRIQKKLVYVSKVLLALCVVPLLSECGDKPQDQTYVMTEGLLESVNGALIVQLACFEGSHLQESLEIPLERIIKDGYGSIPFAGGTLSILPEFRPLPGREQGLEIMISATNTAGRTKEIALGLGIALEDWSRENYVLMPGAVYNGNRFTSVKKQRRVQLNDIIECTPDMDPVITDVPRLNVQKEKSRISLLSGDMASPSIGLHFKNRGMGLILLSGQGSGESDYSFQVRETPESERFDILLRLPGVREDSCHKGQDYYPSPDRGVELDSLQVIRLNCQLFLFEAPRIQSLFDFFAGIRNNYGKQLIPEEIPYSAVWKIQEKKYNLQNWVEDYGYYSVGMRESTYQDWQTGWTGGMNAVFPLLANGDSLTAERALRTIDFLCSTISPSGFFYDVFYRGEWVNQDGNTFLRRNSDALYFLMKSFHLINYRTPGYDLPDHWIKAARNCADAYVRLFKEYGQFGQWVNYVTGEMVVGGTASNGIAPAALALCSSWFNDKEYLSTALDAAEYYYNNFTVKGLTNGGPGDIFQGPDSESAFALLETYMVLYEMTGDSLWLSRAREAANQCASWVVSYNFNFPDGSTFDRMEMKTTGTVVANVQNKHAAPGICTLSGNSLFKLFRFTGDETYLNLISDIARTIPQYMSRADRPIPDPRPGVPWPVMPPGWINERVNMSDWEERGTPGDIRRGEIFGGSTWSEVACMLSYAELPGIYIQHDKAILVIMDHVKARILTVNDTSVSLEISNPTSFDASVKVLIEGNQDQQKVFDLYKVTDGKSIDVLAHETRTISIPKQ